MGDIIIRNLDDALLVELKRRAWQQGLPLEESLRRLVAASIAGKIETVPTRHFIAPPLTYGERSARMRIAAHA